MSKENHHHKNIFNFYDLNSDYSKRFLSSEETLLLISKYLFKKIFQNTIFDNQFQKIFEDLKNKHEKFFDKNFPPNESSLIKNNHDDNNNNKINSKRFKKIKWKRLSELYNNNFSVFPDKIIPNEIKQGALNNCCFLSVISALAENEERIKKFFINQISNENCIYGIKLCINCKLKEYILDDYIPIDPKKDKECFGKGSKNTIWVQLLEKAYAKAKSSYLSSEINDLNIILSDLTCAPIESLDNSTKNLYNYLLQASKNKWPIIASAGDTEASQDLLKEIGLIPIHAYTILNIFIINNFVPETIKDEENEDNINNSTERDQQHINSERDEINYNILLKIRNFSTKDGWMGDWSKGSHCWTKEIKDLVKYEENDDYFFMNLKDFKHYFSKIKICKIYDDYNYTYISLLQKVESYCLVKMDISNDSNNNEINGFIKLLQIKEKNSFPENLDYGIIRIIICKLLKDNDNKNIQYEVEYIKGKMGQERSIFEKIDLMPGSYLIFTELDKNISTTESVLSMYSNGNVTFKNLDINNYPKILEKIYISCAKKQNQVFHFVADGAPECAKYSNTSSEGYTYIYIENNEDDTTLIENVNYTKFEGLKLLPPFKGTSYKLRVGPKQSQIVLIKQYELIGYNLIFSYYSNFQFGQKSLLKLTKTRGKKKHRKDTKLNIDLDIIVYTYKHSLGLCYYYENNTKDRRLDETLKLSNIVGVEIIGKPKGTNEVNIKLEPGDTTFVELRSLTQNWSVQSSVSYKIENL